MAFAAIRLTPKWRRCYTFTNQNVHFSKKLSFMRISPLSGFSWSFWYHWDCHCKITLNETITNTVLTNSRKFCKWPDPRFDKRYATYIEKRKKKNTSSSRLSADRSRILDAFINNSLTIYHCLLLYPQSTSTSLIDYPPVVYLAIDNYFQVISEERKAKNCS